MADLEESLLAVLWHAGADHPGGPLDYSVADLAGAISLRWDGSLPDDVAEQVRRVLADLPRRET